MIELLIGSILLLALVGWILTHWGAPPDDFTIDWHDDQDNEGY